MLPRTVSTLFTLRSIPIRTVRLHRALHRTNMAFALPTLPYLPDALEPYVDSTTMNIHHTKHHQTYVSNINKVLDGPHSSAIKGLSLAAIQQNITQLPKEIRTPVINSGGGHYNHSMFWTLMAKPGTANVSPVGDLKAKIDTDFGSFDQMKTKFNAAAAARFGSGWAWLSVGADGKLFISSTANQENPLMKGVVADPGTPILGLDVWEHAYYLKYQNRRPEYIAAFWNVVNWDQITVNYDSAKDGNTAVFETPLA